MVVKTATKAQPKTSPQEALIAIVAILGGLFTAIVAIITIFARTEAWVLVPIGIMFVLLAGLLGYFVTKRT